MEEKALEPIEDPRNRLKPTGGRDELNLAEFPITLLSDRVPKDCKTITFEVDHRDSQMGQLVTRKVTITGSDAYGLPTAVDDEILLALIQLTKLKNDFTDPTVFFSRYEILKLLDWPDDGRSYRRIEESIRRWTGVTLYYDNAWKDRETGNWVSENFHFIERSSFVDSDTRRVRKAKGQHELALSSFRWNEVIFQSFQVGSLKRLDIDAYFSYATSVAKRMYRFLDKRFWIKPRWEFDLKEFAFNRIGLSSKYNVAQIKSKLQPAIDELCQSTPERAAFLEPMEHEARYRKVAKGEWLIVLSRKTFTALPDAEPVEPSSLVEDLVERGLASEVASQLVKDNEPEFIRYRLEVFDWVMAQPNQKTIKESPSGWLMKSIKDRYLTAPKGFVSPAEAERRREAQRNADRRKAEEESRERQEQERRTAEEKAIKSYWEALAPDQQMALLLEAGISTEPIRPRDYTTEFSRRHQRDVYIRGLLKLDQDEDSAE
ncbi:replication initiator protein A [Paludisphaera mucosa]|uniref:Replication initiator protein A n=1 Tax=Paludisphaera mucosa TaxID=3030827 RepID=A0ABT6FM66_9BACT|nr:replication initiator protein A [Paludisphaera mucosa]MDG3008473.1 replication initiator protein A [Paludisphaera mucosa]